MNVPYHMMLDDGRSIQDDIKRFKGLMINAVVNGAVGVRQLETMVEEIMTLSRLRVEMDSIDGRKGAPNEPTKTNE